MINLKARINHLFVKVKDVLRDEASYVCEIKEKGVAYYRPVVKDSLKRKRHTPERFSVEVVPTR